MRLDTGSSKITTSAVRSRSTQLPPALARALEPKLERTISLKVADLIDAVPAGFIKPVEILDVNALVLLKASELEKGMPGKQPMISLPSLYQQAPEIFLSTVRPDDDTCVALPYEKVLEQFQSAHVRSDQIHDPAVPQLSTPILTATIRDSERFGTKIGPIETTRLPAVPVKHASAESIAEAEPDATPAESPTPTKAPPPGRRVISLHSPELEPKTKAPEPPLSGTEFKIPFELSPNGTGVFASERVPASSGPPVPTPLPFTPEPSKNALKLAVDDPINPMPPTKGAVADTAPSPAKNPAQETAASRPMKLKVNEIAPPAGPPKSGAEPSVAPKQQTNEAVTQIAKTKAEQPVKPLASRRTVEASTPPGVPQSKQDAPTISLSLKAVLQNLPAFQSNCDVSGVSGEVQIAFPLALIEPQLASGRVSIAPDVFQAALPAEHRALFQIDVHKTSVVLPLEEVLKNLPATVLKLRDDQEQLTLDKDFETPFLAKAHEDARRFDSRPEPIKNAPEKPGKKPSAELTEAKSTIEKIDPKKIVSQANALPGVKACAITLSDGLTFAGELPEEVNADGLCAMAPPMLERIAQHLRDTKLGQLVAMTLYASNSAISFFARGDVCLTALHDTSLATETRAHLAEFVEKLSKTYAQPEKSNVDH
jgi:predicted regulator of Ras-like GTPase activity (Roadblock/LC7/MglB family)